MLSKFQSGFRPKHCTVTALIEMCDEWLENMDNGKLNGVVFLDIKNAFDSKNHGILLNKMKKRFGISSIELKWFKSYLFNREQQCSINCYGTDFATTASPFFFFYFGVKLQHPAVAGSQLLLTLPSLAANSLYSAAAGRQLPLLSKNWRLSMCLLRYDWSTPVVRS